MTSLKRLLTLKVRRAVDGVYVYAQSDFLAKHFASKSTDMYLLPEDETALFAGGRRVPDSMSNRSAGMFVSGYDGPVPNLCMLRSVCIGQGVELKFTDPISESMIDLWLDAAEQETQALHSSV
jgi:hypothetical protein